MKYRITFELETDQPVLAADINDELKKRFMSVDGKQHLELMNWEPIPMAIDKINIGIVNEVPIDTTKMVGVFVEEVRQKKFWFTIPREYGEDDDIGDFYDHCVDSIHKALHNGSLDGDQAPLVYMNYTDADELYEWKDIWPERCTSVEIPNENGDWMLE